MKAKNTDDALRRLERKWAAGAAPALVDALILCHKEQKPMPLWVAQGAVTLIKLVFDGKTVKGTGRHAKTTALYKSRMIDYERWCAVEELRERKNEMLPFINSLSRKDRARRPQFALLSIDYSLEQRCEAVAELFTMINSESKGSASTILRSYKRVARNMRLGKTAQYHLPGYENPLRLLYLPS